MSLSREEGALGGQILLIFGSRVCKRALLPPEKREKYILKLYAEEMKSAEDIILDLRNGENGWMRKNQLLREDTPHYCGGEGKNSILLLTSARKEKLSLPGRVWLNAGEEFFVGTEYTNRIFYQCASLIKKRHLKISRDNQGYVLTAFEKEGVYLNGSAFEGEERLSTRDQVDLYGLHLMVIGELLLCISFCGVCRLAENKKDYFALLHKPRSVVRTGCEKQRKQEPLQSIHRGEVELLLPRPLPEETGQPFFLTLGPTLTMVLPVLLMAFLSSRYMEGAGGGFYLLSVAMSGCSALLAFFWGMVNYVYRRLDRRQREKHRRSKYRNYLRQTQEYLTRCRTKNRQLLTARYPDCRELLDVREGNYHVLWNRYYTNTDFLFLPMGRGELPFQIVLKKSHGEQTMEKDLLIGEAQKLIEEFSQIEDVPIGIDLRENRQIAVMRKGFGGEWEAVLIRLIIQAASCLSDRELKIGCFYQAQNGAHHLMAEMIRWLPHSWTPDGKLRFVAGNEKEAVEILPVLSRELERRKKKGNGGESQIVPWYLLVILDEELVKGESLYNCLIDTEGVYPVTAVFVAGEQKALPKSCRFFVEREKGQEEMVSQRDGQTIRRAVKAAAVDTEKAQDFVRKLSGFSEKETQGDGQLPDSLDFLQMFGCQRLKELDCPGRWRTARPEERLKVPIGAGAGGGQIFLDVHEKFHGPHGLIAGTTGSGKSELLQTYLLSVAVSFSPEDVNFFLIDYKGGGTGNILQRLPHCAGVISNLSGKQIKRAMSAISSENKRRQLLLSQNQVNHIDAYAKLYREKSVTQAMPHLILIVDEFAELKKEEPEFMQELISLAQVGRSLGVHLILATQKPAGTVDDKIWSNARFRLCLRVQDKQDSMDMLHNPDAAYLTTPGQCYLQIGSHEYYELFQTGYCGGSYYEEGRKKEEALLVTNTGKRIGARIGADKKKVEVSLLEKVTSYVNQMTEAEGISRAKQLWMPELPDRIDLRELEEEPAMEQKPALLLGLYDDPRRQRQGAVRYYPLEEGHFLVCGGPATGKTTLLQTLIWQLCSSWENMEVRFLLVDMDHESLSCFDAMPGCLGILKDKSGMEVFFYQLERLFKKRKEKLGAIGYLQHRRSSREPMEPLFLIIDHYGALRKAMTQEQEELLLGIAAEGMSCGVFLLLAASGPGEIPGKLFEKIKTTIAFEMSDKFLYGDVLRQYRLFVLPKENSRGRGLCRVNGEVLEFQSPLPQAQLDDYERQSWIAEEGKRRTDRLSGEGRILPQRFARLPAYPDLATLLEQSGEAKGTCRIPLGYSLQSGEPRAIEPAPGSCFLILGAERTGKRTLLRCMMKGLSQNGCEVLLYDPGRRMGRLEEKGIQSFTELPGLLERIEMPVLGKAFLFISELAALGREHQGRKLLEQTVLKKERIAFMAGIYGERDYELESSAFFKGFLSWQQGIHLGGNALEQRLLDLEDMGYAMLSRREPPGIGYLRMGADQPVQRLLLANDRKN